MDIRRSTYEEREELNRNNPNNANTLMNAELKTETKPAKTPRKTRKPRSTNTPVVSAISDVDEDEVRDSFRAAQLKTDLQRSLDSLPAGGSIKVQGDYDRVRGSVRTFEKHNSDKHFELVASVKSPGWVIIKGVTPKNGGNEPITEVAAT